MKTLKLFNAVLAKEGLGEVYALKDQGVVIAPNAAWAKDEIEQFVDSAVLSGEELNKTFHKSWKKIINSSREELFWEQTVHYMSTYGSDFKGEIYIPTEKLNVPELTKVKLTVINAYTKKQFIEKCLGMLRSGIALAEETLNDIFSILVDFNYEFTGSEGIKNKEAIVIIADTYSIYPKDASEFMRLMVFKAIGEATIVKSDEVILKIKNSTFDPSMAFNRFGLDELSEVFNRFKPLFLAFKGKCPSKINKIAKLSKKNHKAMVQNPMNVLTSKKIKEEDMHWLSNATPFALMNALAMLHNRINGQDTFVYRIRNGKSFAKEGVKANVKVCKKNYKTILRFMQSKWDFSEMKFYEPKNISYAVPTSEKMFVGNVPTGTKIFAKKIAAGIYWKNSWGAIDLDLSGINVGGKVGWNSTYNQGGGALMSSGDITNAPNGAVEYLYANRGLKEPTLVMNNVYEGDDNSEFKIIVGKGGKVSRDYMMNPDNLVFEQKVTSVEAQSVLGMVIPEEEEGLQSFVLLNFGAGSARVSGYGKTTDITQKALFQQWKNPLTLKKVLKKLGAESVENPNKANLDLSVESLTKDTFTKIFEK